MRAVATIGAVMVCAAGLPGCRAGGTRSASEENDLLRRDAIQLRDRIADLEGRNRELTIKLESEVRARRESLPADIADAFPVVVGIDIDALSGLRPAGRGSADRLAVSFVPRDGRGRFVQVVGTATLSVTRLPESADGSGEGAVLAVTDLKPASLRDAYRSGLTGQFYEVELALASPIDRATESGSLAVHLVFADAITGQTHRASRVIPIR